MRITNAYIANNMIRNVQSNLSQLARIDEQMSTTKSVLRPSDDPNIMSQLLSVKSALSYNEKYAQNIEDGLSYLDMADTAMGTLADVLAQAKVYATQGANATYNAEDRLVLAKQIDNTIDQVIDLANVTVSGKYVFAGKQNNIAPFVRDGDKIIYRGDFNKIEREVLAGTSYAINVPAVLPDEDKLTDEQKEKLQDPSFWGYDRNTIFGKVSPDGNNYQVMTEEDDPDNVFKALFDLKHALESDDREAIDACIDRIESVRDDVLQARVEVGARYNHFEMLKNHLLDQEVAMTGDLQNMEGADMAKLSIELNQQWLAYSASMAAGSTLMKTSLLDFIR